MKAIRRVSVVSTGSVRIRPQHVQSDGTPLAWWLNTSQRWTAPRPINVYVIEHESGLILFDTGQDRRSVLDPGYFPGGVAGYLYRRLATFDIPPEATLTHRLEQLGYDIGDVRIAILSHLHQDHIGGLGELPSSARVLVSRVDAAEGERRFAVLAGILTDHIRIPGLDWTVVSPERLASSHIAPFTEGHDVVGDGSLILLPTPGHTPGSLSLLLRDSGMAPMLFVGDLTYDVRLLEQGRVPGVGNARVLRETTRRVNELVARNPGMVVLAAHDPMAATLLETATTTRAE